MATNLFVTPTIILSCPSFFALSRYTGMPRTGSVEDAVAMQGMTPSRYHENKFEDSSEEEEAYGKNSPREEALKQMVKSEFWENWAKVSTSPAAIAVVIVNLIFIVPLAYVQFTSMNVSEDFFFLGPQNSMWSKTITQVGEDFSPGLVGASTVVITSKATASAVAQPAASQGLFADQHWSSATKLLQRIDTELLAGGKAGAIFSPMYLSTPGKGSLPIEIQYARMADEKLNPNYANLGTKAQELNFVIGQTMNDARTASVAMVSPNLRTTSPESVLWTVALRNILNEVNADPTSPIEVYMTSQTSGLMDVREAVYAQLPLFVCASLAGCLILIGLMFRSVLLAVRSVVSISFTLAVVYIFGIGVFQQEWLTNIGIPIGGNEGLFFIVPVITFTIVVGLALDYDIFLLGRVLELKERGHDSRVAIELGVAETGHVITCAGSIMAVAFGGALFSEVESLRQSAWIFVSAVLLDTFVVRTVLTPALTMALGEANWWPREFRH
eukprot:TRINITY_DN36507_c0_g1_i1.p1 TRINITY_DN36507_c0_g1~~TRINITY_DN36507_c0_g1_i1.p1  ORF type:complete len:547 (-),score=71.47 TRINITY_DN36507_c0_g1_i1:54-1550(-)